MNRVALSPSPQGHLRVRFQHGGPFQSELRRRIDDYFEQRGLGRRANGLMYLKTGIILAWFGVTYGLLVFGHLGWVANLPLAISVGLATAGIGFNIQHDASHGGFFDSRILNRLLSFSADLVGASSYVWRFKHNFLHHTYPNIVGADADISAGPMLRFAPSQPRRRVQRLQWIYAWGLYALLSIKWELFDDFRDVAVARIGTQPFPRPKSLELAALIAGKSLFFGWALILPMLLHPIGAVLLYFALASCVLGITLSVTFQLGHCVEEAEFLDASPKRPLPRDWAEHQVRST